MSSPGRKGSRHIEHGLSVTASRKLIRVFVLLLDNGGGCKIGDSLPCISSLASSIVDDRIIVHVVSLAVGNKMSMTLL